MSALPACKLDRVVAHAARRPVDQNLLPGLQIGQAEQCKPGSACADGDRGSLVKADVVRLWCQRVGRDHGIVGIGSLCPSSVDRLTYLEGCDARTEQFDGSRKLTSRRERQGNWPDIFE